MTGTLLHAALEWQAAGASVIRARNDGIKAPRGNWKQYQVTAPSAADITEWYGNGSAPDGLGLVCGAVSGGLDMFEFEGRAVAEGVLDAFLAALGERGLAPLWQRITAGYTEQTPSGGIHALYRLGDATVPGNTKLAERPARDDEITPKEREIMAKRPGWVPRRTLIETRGEGGFVVIAPSGGRTHETGREWVRLLGGQACVVTITAADREALCEAARTQDQMPRSASPGTGKADPTRASQIRDVRAVTVTSAWHEIMSLGGWAHAGTGSAGHDLWTRPGKDAGTSATTSEGGGLYVFSSSTEFQPETPYSKAAVLAVFRDDMDPAQALAEFGAPADQEAAGWKAMLASMGTSEAELAARDAGAPRGAREPGRPRFDVSSRAVAADMLRAALGTGKLAGLYLRDSALIHTPRTGEDGYIPPTRAELARGVDPGPAQVRPVDAAHVKALCEVVYEVGQMSKPKDKNAEPQWFRTLFPPDVAASAVNAAEIGVGCPNLAYLSGITHTPVIRPDGSVLATPGYDRATGLLYLPEDGLVVPPVPEYPPAADVSAAMTLLCMPIAEFPFVAPHHAANYLGAMLTPVLRLLLPPPYQLVVITATNPGSGKTLLMRMLGAVHGIATRGEFPRDRDELRKLFLATLLTTTAPVIGMDNLRGTIYSSELEALLTARTLTDRYLGQSKVVTVTNDRLWVATGNNARIGGDLARRCLPIALDPQCADPHKRTGFKIEPAAWLAEHRGEYLAALLTVARGWIQAGQPSEVTRSDDYARWDGALRGLLAWARLAVGPVPAVFGAEDGEFAVAEDDEEWGAFVWELARVFGDQPFTAKQIEAQLGYATPLADALPGDLAERRGKAGFTRSLGKWLSYRDGRITSDQLTVRMQRGRTATFQITGIKRDI